MIKTALLTLFTMTSLNSYCSEDIGRYSIPLEICDINEMPPERSLLLLYGSDFSGSGMHINGLFYISHWHQYPVDRMPDFLRKQDIKKWAFFPDIER